MLASRGADIKQDIGHWRRKRDSAKSPAIVIMGVSACGKSTFGKLLAERLGADFVDGDDLHPECNIRKMASGIALDDVDRQPWLESIRDLVRQVASQERRLVIACSALKRAYRDLIRQGDPQVRFIFLDVEKALILNRIRARAGHFMKDAMVDSQFSVLEIPNGEPNTLMIDGSKAIEEMIEDSLPFLEGASD